MTKICKLMWNKKDSIYLFIYINARPLTPLSCCVTARPYCAIQKDDAHRDALGCFLSASISSTLCWCHDDVTDSSSLSLLEFCCISNSKGPPTWSCRPWISDCSHLHQLLDTCCHNDYWHSNNTMCNSIFWRDQLLLCLVLSRSHCCCCSVWYWSVFNIILV